MTCVVDLAFIFGRRALCIFLIGSEVLWIVTLSHPLRRRLLTTLSRPPPTAVAESQWGEPRSDAFGTGARVAGSISLWSVLLPLVGNRVGWRRGRRGRAGVAGLSFIGSWLWSDALYARFVVVVESSSPGWRPLERCSMPLPPPSPSDDLRPPSSYRRRGVAEGRSILTWHHYGCQVGEEEGGVGREWQAYSSSSPGRGAMVSVGVDAGGPWSAAPCLFLRRRPLTTLGRPPPTAVAESQRGEPRSDAFGTGARVAGSISLWLVLLSLVGNRVGWRRGRRGRAGVAGLSFIGSWLWSDALYARFVVVVELPDSPRLRAGGPWSAAPCLFLRRRPLTTLGRPPPTAVAESQRGEPRSDAFGTDARVAGSISLWSVLLSLVDNRVGWRRGRRGRAGVAGLPFIGSWLWSDAPHARFVVVVELPDSPRLRAGGPYNVAPCLFLRRRPLMTLGRPPTAVAESQRGEPRSDAFGTDARVAGSTSLRSVLLPLCRVGEEEGGAGQGGSGRQPMAMLGDMDSWMNPMSSPDSYDYGDLELTSEVLNELLVIETTEIGSTSIPFMEEPNPGSNGPIASTSSIKKELPPTDPHSDDLFDPTFVLRATDLEGLEAIEQHYPNAIPLPHHSLYLAQSLITSRGDGKSPSPDEDEPSTSRRGTQHKSPIHSIDHKVKQLDLTALVKSDAKRKARDSDDEEDEEGEQDTRRRPTLKRQRGRGRSRRSRKPPSRKVRHIKAVTTGTDTRSGIDSGIDSDDPIDFLRS
ncbi:hypothetical protein EDB83DRAFT_2327653 [Lactarius deliciosus]|nr:hypothetical protein EDB83DRAFT_2327653 [Lactarius deliciosus]